MIKNSIHKAECEDCIRKVGKLQSIQVMLSIRCYGVKLTSNQKEFKK